MMKPLTPAAAAASRQALESVGEQRVQIAHQEQRRPWTRPDRRELVEQPGEREAGGERGVARTLDGHPVGHRIGERHADLDDVGNVGDRGETLVESPAVRESAGQERDQRRATAVAAPRVSPHRYDRAARLRRS